jgi:catechol 2,3-dioxygenase-like lactoylglutathione lyase family enzyme
VGLALAVTPELALAQEARSGVIGLKLGVTDFQRSADFYRHLGLEVGRKPNAIEWELRSASTQGGAVIYIVRSTNGASRIPAGGGFVMIGVRDVRATGLKLKQAGYTGIEEPRVTAMYATLIVRDPDGNQIEILGPGQE